MSKLNKLISQEQKDFDAFNARLDRLEIPNQCKGALVLELWQDYDRLQFLKQIKDQVDLSKVSMHFSRGRR